MSEAALLLKDALGDLSPGHAIVLGSGLGGLADEIENPRRFAFSELPGFPVGAVSGHQGSLIAGTLAGTP